MLEVILSEPPMAIPTGRRRAVPDHPSADAARVLGLLSSWVEVGQLFVYPL